MATGDTLAALRNDIGEIRSELHDLDKSVVEMRTRSEERHGALMSRLDQLAADLSDQGKAPIPTRTGLGSLVPASWTPAAVAQAFLILVPVLAGVWGVSYSGAQSGGSSGATTAVETAVEQGDAVPIATPPTIRVVPIVKPVLVPVPEPPVPEPDPVVHPDDLMPRVEP